MKGRLGPKNFKQVYAISQTSEVQEMKMRKLKPGVKIALVSTLAGVVLGASINTIAHTCDTPKTDETPNVEEKVVIKTNPDVKDDVIIEKKISLGEFKVTAYCPCELCSAHWGDTTYMGTTAEAGRTIAVDPEVIPLGSEVEIDGDTYIAEDIGGAVKGNHVDIYFNTHDEAIEWGRQFHDVLLIKE